MYGCRLVKIDLALATILSRYENDDDSYERPEGSESSAAMFGTSSAGHYFVFWQKNNGDRVQPKIIIESRFSRILSKFI
jgi:hypothetical protein